jgi:plastocyanin
VSLPRLLLPAAAALAATVLEAGCGGAGGHGPAVATDHVSMAKSYRFDPDVIRIKAGDTVTWTNNDNFTHSVRLQDGGETQFMKPGESVTHAFTTPGVYQYDCSLHPKDMRGSVQVDAGSQ